MIQSLKKNEAFEYQKLTPEEMKSMGILGRLIGPCADLINPTRNGRGYNEELWNKVFEDPIVIEKIKNKCLFGELCHPTDREEVDLEKIAIALNEIPKKDSNGKLIACFDILDTPNGRILKTLCDYGTIIGISSRGTGDVITDSHGDDIVDPDTYNFECFDAVIVPAVKEARLQYVTESLNTNTLRLRQALTEDLERASVEDRAIMEDTLETLGLLEESVAKNNPYVKQAVKALNSDGNLVAFICSVTNPATKKEVKICKGFTSMEDLNEYVSHLTKIYPGYVSTMFQGKQHMYEECISEDCADIDETSDVDEEENEVAENNGTKELLKNLQDSLKTNAELTTSIQELQERIAVSDTKVSDLEEELNRKKSTIIKLTQLVRESKTLSERISTLEEEIKKRNQIIESLKRKQSSLNESVTTVNSIREELNIKDNEIKSLTESIETLKKEHETELTTLRETYEREQEDFTHKLEELGSKLSKSKKLVEGYKNLANETINKYIENKALMIGVSIEEIKNKLSERYTIEEVDKVCESLKAYKLNISRLPFQVDRNVVVRVNESRDITSSAVEDIDDVDEQTLRMAGLIK